FNNTFDASNEPIRCVPSNRKSQIDQTRRFIGYTDEEREKLIKMEAYMKQFGADERQWTKHAATINLQKSRHSKRLGQRGFMGEQIQSIDLALTNPSVLVEDSVSSLEFSKCKGLSGFIGLNPQFSKSIVDVENSLNIYGIQSAAVNPALFEPIAGEFY